MSLKPTFSILLIWIKGTNSDSVQNFFCYKYTIGVNRDMNSTKKSEDATTTKKMGINVAIIIGVLLTLVYVSVVIADIPS